VSALQIGAGVAAQLPSICGYWSLGQHLWLIVTFAAGQVMQAQSEPSIWPFWQGSALGGHAQPLAPGFVPDGHTVETGMQVPLLKM